MRELLLMPSPTRRLVLGTETALELMVPRPFSLPARMTIQEAAACLAAAGVGGVPVVDPSGRPVGVLSRTDILRHAGGLGVARAPAPPGTAWAEAGGRVADLMTPAVFSVRPKTPSGTVVDSLLALAVHQLFVLDEGGAVIGVVSDRDVLRHLCRERPGGEAFPG
jgi:CBS domain-containing protein